MRFKRFYGSLTWGLLASYVALAVLAVSLMYLNGTRQFVSNIDYPLVFLPYAIVGSLVASRRPENPIGWIFCVLAITNVIRILALEYALYSFAFHPETLPGKEIAEWLATGWINSLGDTLMMTFVPLYFPTGRLLSPRWRPVAYLAAFASGLRAFGLAFEPSYVDVLPHVQNPLGIRGGAGVFSAFAIVGSLIVLLTVLVCVWSLVLRYRRARREERQQIQWLAYAVVFLTAFVVIALLNSIIRGGNSNGPLWSIVADFGIVGIPAAVGVAILKYRLYDIDVVINRTLVYGSLTATLVALYFGGIVLLQRVFVAFTGERSTLAVVASTLLIAALFNPLRRRIQSFIDRRFYRRKYDARKTLEAFSVKLRDEIDLETLDRHLVGVVAETMQPAHISLWLRPDAEPDGERRR